MPRMFVRLCVAMTQPTSLYPWQQFVNLLQSHCSCHFYGAKSPLLYTQEGVLIIQYVIIVASLVISTEY